MAKKTQRDRVLEYIDRFGSISSWDAYKDLGITQLGARIWELTHRYNYKFKKERIYTKNRFGDTTHYDKYYLVEESNG